MNVIPNGPRLEYLQSFFHCKFWGIDDMHSNHTSVIFDAPYIILILK